jgi:2-polyprenyl-3-methyl-5-hydroxy-6-metoxy-1,4-benzoquinol methylase
VAIVHGIPVAQMSPVLTQPSASSSVSLPLTGRQDRERRYYDEFVKRTPHKAASLQAVRGEKRPWNPYWYVAQLVVERFSSPSQRLLDFGCGPGTYAVQMAHVGYEVHGFDISPSNIAAADELAAGYHVAERTHFKVGQAERLEYPDAYFDVIVGIDILHHVEIRQAILECMRTLKPGGVAIFKEPVEAPLFDRLRQTRLGLAVQSKEPSFEHHVTEDERKLTAQDLAVIKEISRVQERHFRLVSRLETLIGNRLHTRAGASRLEMLDALLLERCSPLRRLAGSIVLTCSHSKER